MFVRSDSVTLKSSHKEKQPEYSLSPHAIDKTDMPCH
jgi:hypothetical protein